MRRTNKNILAFEASWDTNVIEPRTGMRSLLDFIVVNKGTQYSYNFVNTPHELEYVLRNANTRKFSMLYFGFHGDPNKIKMGVYQEHAMTLDELAIIMGYRFAGYSIHFASCAVLDIDTEIIMNFKAQTGASFVSGYRHYVDFDASTLVDIALINSWMYSRNYNLMFKRLEKRYKHMLNENGFIWI